MHVLSPAYRHIAMQLPYPTLGNNVVSMVFCAAGLHNGDVAINMEMAVENLKEDSRAALDKDPAIAVTPVAKEPDRANEK